MTPNFSFLPDALITLHATLTHKELGKLLPEKNKK